MDRGRAMAATRGRAPLGSSDGGFTAVRSGRSLLVPLAAVATVVRRERVPLGSSNGGATASRCGRSPPAPSAAG